MRKGLLLLCVILLHACTISYKFNGASIDYSTTKTISIADFPNMAALVHPPLSNNLSDGIRDLFQRQTRLEQVRRGGNLEIEGEITGYTLTPMAVSADSYASETKLTITVKVQFTNVIEPEASFNQTFKAFADYDSTQLLTEIQAELDDEIIQQLVTDIYMAAAANW